MSMTTLSLSLTLALSLTLTLILTLTPTLTLTPNPNQVSMTNEYLERPAVPAPLDLPIFFRKLLTTYYILHTTYY